MTVYADVLFLINFIQTYILVLLICAYKHTRPPYARKIFSAAAGGIFSLFIFLSDMEQIWLALVYIFSAAAVCMIAFGKKGLARNILIFVMLSFLLGSCVTLCISFLGNNIGMILKNNIIYFDISSSAMLIAFALSYPLICIFSALIRQRAHKRLHELTIINKGKSISLTALYDSGNLLREPLSGKGVIIVENAFADKIITENQSFVQIPFSSVGGSSYMRAFIPDMIIKDNRHIITAHYIGITESRLSQTNEYNALIGDF